MSPAVCCSLIALAIADGTPKAKPGGSPASPDTGWLDAAKFGVRGDGVSDDTAALQAALNAGPVLLRRPSAFYRTTQPLRVTHSLRGEGRPEVRIVGADGTEAKQLLRIEGHSDGTLTISGLHLNGGWVGARGKGEWSHLIAVLGSRDVRIEDNLLENSLGDNVYIGKLESQPYTRSSNIHLIRNRMRRPYRCNVAVVAADNVVIEDNQIAKQNGYVAAIDIEPNPDALDWVSGVVIRDNQVDVSAVYVQAYSPDRRRDQVVGVRVEGNTGRARIVYRVPEGSGSVQNVIVRDNRLE